MSLASLTAEHVTLAQTSWEKVLPIGDTVADLFYNKIFELDPSLRPLFPDDMTSQKKKLINMMSLAVNSLTILDKFLPEIKNLGLRHAMKYKVTPPMYETVGEALLLTLEKFLEDSWDETHREAWSTIYCVLSEAMTGNGEEKKSPE
jgi:hemoglobin-like flavoprotein